jgi:membrane associated rhomboid family serine protease
MGISDRDYVRSSGRSSSLGGFGWDVIGWLIAVSIVIYVVQLLTAANPDAFTSWFDLRPSAVLHGQIWRLLTYDFLHDHNNLWHIIINLYVLYIAGQKLLSNHTEKEFLLFYLASGLAAGVAFFFWQLARGSDVGAIGASGSVAAVLTLYALYWPHDRWLIFYILPVPVLVLVLLSAAFDLYPILLELGGQEPRDNIAHMAHLGGMAFALVYYKLDWRIEPFIGDFSLKKLTRAFRRKPRLRVHRPVQEESQFDMQSHMDELLEKISRQGEASLTTEERETLNRISRQLRSRKG